MNEKAITLQDLLNLLETNKKLLMTGDSRKLLDFILDEAIRLSGAERGFIILLPYFPSPSRESASRSLLMSGAGRVSGESQENELKEFEVAAARNLDREDLKKAREKFSKTVFRQVIETGEPLITMDAGEDRRLKTSKSVMEMNLTSILGVPMVLSETPLGVLYLDHRFTEGAFQEHQVKMVKLFADQAALALNALRSIDEAERHAGELARMQGQLALLNEQLQERMEQVEGERDRAKALLGHRSLQKGFEGIVGNSKPLKKILRTIEQLQEADATVYIHGESGTGKELIARALHHRSHRKEKPFVALNCAAFSEQILDSELFGHLRGAFTGADRDRRGLFEEASGGTIFLDEVGEMSPSMQAKLLRVLQEKEIRPVGSNTPKKVNVRVVAASNKDLFNLMKAGTFREDLYYRLNVVRLDLPPLRERREDIADLVQHFMQNNPVGIPKEFLSLEPEALQLLMNYRWPGNIRELQNEIQRCLVLGKGHISVSLLSPSVRESEEGETVTEEDLQLEKRLKGLEKRLLIRALEEARGNKKEAAEKLGISRVKLYQKIKQYGLAAEYGKLTGARIRKVLREVRGNKTLAAKKLGIGRRTLYEKLEKLG